MFMGNDHALEIVGISPFKLKMYSDTVCTIKDVRHVKGLMKNRLFLGQLDSIGCKTHVKNGIMKVVKGAFVVMKVEKVAINLYMLKRETLEEVEAVVSTNSEEESKMMWHQS